LADNPFCRPSGSGASAQRKLRFIIPSTHPAILLRPAVGFSGCIERGNEHARVEMEGSDQKFYCSDCDAEWAKSSNFYWNYFFVVNRTRVQLNRRQYPETEHQTSA
jgi:hypothetical protein